MKVGTRSLLFGGHQFIIHPLMVALAWWRLYGIPWDPRLWVAFIVHDWGYWGKPNMDGKEGDMHIFTGAKIMGWLFDPFCKSRAGEVTHKYYVSWYCFCFYHSRTIYRRYGVPPSRLCIADKLSWAMEPWWFFIPRTWITGELKEYMSRAGDAKYDRENLPTDGGAIGWYKAVKQYLDTWAYDHRNIREDMPLCSVHQCSRRVG